MHLFGILLMIIGAYGLLTNRHIIKMIIALNIIEIGLNIFIISVGYTEGLLAPILTSEHSSSTLGFVDPLPQALVLTAIVIGVGTTAVLLAVARKLYQQYGTFDINEMEVG